MYLLQSHFSALKEVRLKSAHYLIIKIYNNRKLQIIAFNHSADIDYKGFMNIGRRCTSDQYSFLTIDMKLSDDNSLRFRKNPLDIN